MKDNDIKIGLIHGSQSLTSELLKLAKKQNYTILAETCSAENALSAGKHMEQNGVDVIISRRHTANVLSSNLNIPVLAIPVRFLDIYQSVLKASKEWKSVLFPIYSESNEHHFILKEKTVNPHVIYYPYESSDQTEKVILQGKEWGCQGVVAGGPNYQKIALKHGLEYEEIVMTSKSLEFALKEAHRIAANCKKEEEQSLFFHSLLNMGSQYIIAVDRSGNINIITNLARQLFRLKNDQPYPHNINKIMPSRKVLSAIESANPLKHHLEKIGDKTFLIDYIPLELKNRTIGGIIKLHEEHAVSSTKNNIAVKAMRRFTSKYSIDDFIYCSPEMDTLMDKVKKYADYQSTILIRGASGTGKEIMANAIHQLSRRKTEPFISINCASIPESLLESELFGYEEGAFTGALRGGKAGLFELANRGTIFLDEIGSMPLNLQARLLRVLQEREIMRIGGTRLIPIDVMVISATNKDLKKLIADGQFRDDLYFRINVLSIYIPSLRERMQDIPLLVRKLTERISRKLNAPVIEIPDQYVNKLLLLSWPGNVRELSSFLERLIIMCDGRFSGDVFEKIYLEFYEYSNPVSNNDKPVVPHTESRDPDAQEDQYADIAAILKECRFSKKITAQRLGISRVTLWRKMKKLSL